MSYLSHQSTLPRPRYLRTSAPKALRTTRHQQMQSQKALLSNRTIGPVSLQSESEPASRGAPPAHQHTDFHQQQASRSPDTHNQLPAQHARPLPRLTPVGKATPLQRTAKPSVPNGRSPTNTSTSLTPASTSRRRLCLEGSQASMATSTEVGMPAMSVMNGLSNRNAAREGLQARLPPSSQVSAAQFINKPLPPIPNSGSSTSQGARQSSRRPRDDVKSRKAQPDSSTTSTHISSSGKAKHNRLRTLDPTAGPVSPTPLPDQPKDSARYSPADSKFEPGAQMRSGMKPHDSSGTINVPPEQTAWKRTAYTPGPIKLQKPGGFSNVPLSPLGLNNSNFGAGSPTAPFDLFKHILDDTSSSTKRSEDTTLSEVAQYVESFGFEPVTFLGDDFWAHNDDQTRAARDTFVSKSSAELPFYYDFRLSSITATNPRSSLGASAHRRNFSTGSRATGIEYVNYQSIGAALGPKTPRSLPSSPAALHPQNVMSERERKAALKSMGAGSASAGHKVGFMRLLRGAGNIV